MSKIILFQHGGTNPRTDYSFLRHTNVGDYYIGDIAMSNPDYRILMEVVI